MREDANSRMGFFNGVGVELFSVDANAFTRLLTGATTPNVAGFGLDGGSNFIFHTATGKVYSFVTGTTTVLQTDSTGAFSTIGGLAAVGKGLPVVVGHGAVTGQTANVASSSTFTPGATGSFEIEVRINVTGVAVGITPQVTYTDPTSGAVTDAISLDREGVAAPVLTATAVDRYTGRTLIRSTNAAITVLTTGYVSGTYDLASWIKQVA